MGDSDRQKTGAAASKRITLSLLLGLDSGHNGYRQSELPSMPKDAECVIGLSFGHRLSSDNKMQPGTSNQDLAAFIVRRYPDKPLLLQHEIAESLQSMSSLRPALSVGPKENHYLDSRDVLIEAKEYMNRMGLASALLVAQSHHAPRVRLIAEKLGVTTIVPDGLPDTWDSLSAQWWTRSKLLWNVREPATFVHHKLAGWI